VIDKQRWWKRFGAKQDSSDLCDLKASAVNEPAIFILKHLAKLPLRQREVFVLRHWHGFSTTECAKLLNIGEGSVKSHLSRAVAGLKKALSENHILSDNQTAVRDVSNGENL
jgi:RNA polymerase sigma-70 factor (ECF subfamily)